MREFKTTLAIGHDTNTEITVVNLIIPDDSERRVFINNIMNKPHKARVYKKQSNVCPICRQYDELTDIHHLKFCFRCMNYF